MWETSNLFFYACCACDRIVVGRPMLHTHIQGHPMFPVNKFFIHMITVRSVHCSTRTYTIFFYHSTLFNVPYIRTCMTEHTEEQHICIYIVAVCFFFYLLQADNLAWERNTHHFVAVLNLLFYFRFIFVYTNKQTNVLNVCLNMIFTGQLNGIRIMLDNDIDGTRYWY